MMTTEYRQCPPPLWFWQDGPMQYQFVECVAAMSFKPRPTEEEFADLKRARDEGFAKAIREIAAEHDWDVSKMLVHRSHADGCYCACPDGPCQHVWDGPNWTSEDGCAVSATCSRCGTVAMYHDMRCGP